MSISSLAKLAAAGWACLAVVPLAPFGQTKADEKLIANAASAAPPAIGRGASQ
jgi:hypothetical protein